MPLDVQGTFVSQKINKVRWIPEEYAEAKCFFTGSWDDVDNSVKVWSLESPTDEDEVSYPREVSEYKVSGDVTEIKFVEKNRIAVSTSDGDVRVLEVSAYDKSTPLREINLWEQIHKYSTDPCSCTTLDVLDGDIATAGEDGIVNILSSRRGDVTRTINGADSCSIHSICFLKHTELITGNIRGHMKIWDLRSLANKPAASFLLSGDELAATCLLHHPTQPHIILAGSEAGSLAVWDLRLNSYPTSLLKAHTAAVTEMQFHPENPQKLLTTSVSGDIWDWNMEAMTRSTKGPDNTISYLPLDESSNMNVTSLMPPLHTAVNTLHADRGRVLCGADNEAIYLINNFKY